ncbi:MAG TPA: DUF2141 domain-containing protein [Bacteroidales bacterium]|nr:DUF2141 domain-containing protein [Bacteroidales bacterium]
MNNFSSTIKKPVLIFLGLLFTLSPLFAQYNLTIEIGGLRNNQGKIMLQLFDINKNIIKQDSASISGRHCSITLTGLNPGKYAVRYYHDENENGIMETNFVGKPVEGYGFSNNVTAKFGPPPFEKWIFNLDSDKKILLKPTY